MRDTFQYCLDMGVLGVGWQIQSTRTPASWEAYLEEAERIYDNVNVCKYIKKWVSGGDLVWTRDPEGKYYLARVDSGWEYWMPDEATDKDIDLANIFRVKFLAVSLDAVPGKVVACFRPPKTLQEICSASAIEYTKYLWNKLAGSADYEVNFAVASDIFEFLDDEETEDVVFLYLQSKGWFIVPNSRKMDTMKYEFYAVNPANGSRAVTQVKTGNVQIDQDDYASTSEIVYLFQSQEKYIGKRHKNVHCLQRQELLAFMNASYHWLPASLQRKLDINRSLASM
jgi:hypothetical protein